MAAELLYSAPFYQNVRKHNTNVGEILCTGIGCVACNPEKNGDKSMVKILGDADTVNFEMGSNDGKNNVLKTRERPETAPGCYGNDINRRHGGSKKIKKIKKKIAKKIPTSGEMMTPKILVTDVPQNYENKKTKISGKAEIESPKQLKEKQVKNVQTGKEDMNDSRKYLTVPQYKSKTQNLRRTTAKKTMTLHIKNDSGKSRSQITKINTEKHFCRERKLYHTFPGARVTRRQGKYDTNPQDTRSFLEMLKTSEIGIYDAKMMELKNSSIWIEKILKQGVKEEELLPRIPASQALKERKSGDGSELQTTDKITQTSLFSNAILPRLSLNGKAEARGGESVLIIEHKHDKMKERDGMLYRLGFAFEEPRHVKGSRNFPRFSIIEMADSLGEFVEMGVIKVIQRRNKRWLILVEGKNAKNFLLQNGVVLGGRHFELIELQTF